MAALAADGIDTKLSFGQLWALPRHLLPVSAGAERSLGLVQRWHGQISLETTALAWSNLVEIISLKSHSK